MEASETYLVKRCPSQTVSVPDLGLAGEYENEYQQTCRHTQTGYNEYAGISTGQEPS